MLNRSLKRDIFDWSFADALLAIGPMQDYIVEGIREIVLTLLTPAQHQGVRRGLTQPKRVITEILKRLP